MTSHFFSTERKSNSGIYGLISKRGVPSNISAPVNDIRFSSLEVSRTTEIPNGLGRQGWRVAKKPISRSFISSSSQPVFNQSLGNSGIVWPATFGRLFRRQHQEGYSPRKKERSWSYKRTSWNSNWQLFPKGYRIL